MTIERVFLHIQSAKAVIMLQIHEESMADFRVLSLSGTMDFYGMQEFKEGLSKAEKEPINQIILDLSLVPFIDSTFLGVLVTTQKRLAQFNRGICLIVDPESMVGQTLNLPGIQKLMPTFHSKKEALSSFLAKSDTSQP